MHCIIFSFSTSLNSSLGLRPACKVISPQAGKSQADSSQAPRQTTPGRRAGDHGSGSGRHPMPPPWPQHPELFVRRPLRPQTCAGSRSGGRRLDLPPSTRPRSRFACGEGAAKASVTGDFRGPCTHSGKACFTFGRRFGSVGLRFIL